MTETDVPEPDYDAMSPSDRAFALFTAVEAARSEAIAEMREAGRRIDYGAINEAHQAALAVWNAWAQPLLEEREALEEAESWLAKNEFNAEFMTHVETGQHLETKDFLRRADINARAITFIGVDWQGENKGDGEEKTIAADTEPPVKTISCEDINLTSFSFPGYAGFSSAQFKGNAGFSRAQIKGNADFSSAQFKGYADFSSAQFKGYANFRNAQFKGNAGFSRAQIKGNAGFRSAQFKGYADFCRVQIKGNADFSNAQFKGYADFSSARFKGNAVFHSAQFKGNADFNRAQFKGYAGFISAQFKGDAHFSSAQFKGYAGFISAQFKGYAHFSSAQFKGNASFAQVDFLTHANFSRAVISLGSDWTAINAVRAFNMAGARFETQVPQFTQAHFTESPRVDNVELPEPGRGHSTLPAPKPETGWITKQVHSWGWAAGATHDDEDSMRPIQAKWEELKEGEELGDPPDGETRRETERDGKRYRYRERKLPKPKPGKPIDADDIAAFTALRRIAMQGEDHETERKAFKGEMRTRRVAGGHKLGYRFASWAYDLFTSFGASFMRPLFLWAVLTLASAGIYAVAANNAKPTGCDTPITSSAQLSLHNALLFATAGQRTFVQDAQICLYGQEAKTKRSAAPAWLGIFGTVQTLLSAMLIFFILLALRNRFKI